MSTTRSAPSRIRIYIQAKKHNDTERDIAIALFVYFIAVTFQCFLGLRSTGFVFVYPLDDTYTHMAIAKHFAGHGVWGVTPYLFSSSTSSPLFDLLLMVPYLLLGPVVWAPLLISLIFGATAIVVAGRILPSPVRLPALLTLIAAVPLSTMTALGMEHTLHIALTLAFAAAAAEAIERRAGSKWLFLSASLLPLARYERLFLVIAAAGLLALRRCFRLSAGVALAGAIPMTAYGVLSVAKGWHFFPNSVLLKGVSQVTLTGHFLHQVTVLIGTPPLLFALYLLLGVAFSHWLRRWSISYNLAILALLSMAVHIALAGIGVLFRYEAYLIALAVVAIAAALPLGRIWLESWTTALLILTGAAFLGRFLLSTTATQQMTAAIYTQQYQLGRFLAAYYPNARVAVNDIGVIDYENNVHVLDLVGLASEEVLSAKLRHAYDSAAMDREAARQSIQFAAVYDSWFDGTAPAAPDHGPRIPARWELAGKWVSPGARPPRREGRHLLCDTTLELSRTPRASRGIC